MAEIKVYNFDGSVAEEMNVSDDVFALKQNPTLLHEILNAMLANKRQVLAHTKTKGEVRGGGKKPWKQKGTGRARHGSSRSPLWVGGGITFGPRGDRNYKLKINKQEKSQALSMILSDKLKSGEIIAVKKIDLKAAKTKEIASLLGGLVKKLGKELRGNNLIVSSADKNLKLAARNLKLWENAGAADLNPLIATKSNLIVIEKDMVRALESRLTKKQ